MSTVHVAKEGPVRIVTIDRFEARNAVDHPTAEALVAAFEGFESDAEARVAILTGAGGTFCSGADLKSFGTDRMNRLSPDGPGPMGPTRMLLRKPVIAAVEGYCVAGGLELALWCDLRVAARDSVFGVYCRRWGVPLIDGGTIRLPRAIGMSHAMDMILTGRSVGAEEAHRMGLVNRLVDPGSTLGSAIALATEIASHPQVCMRSDRLSSHQQWAMSLQAAMTNEFECGMQVVASGESAAGAWEFSKGSRSPH